jgi:hypothetical protein
MWWQAGSTDIGHYSKHSLRFGEHVELVSFEESWNNTRWQGEWLWEALTQQGWHAWI